MQALPGIWGGLEPTSSTMGNNGKKGIGGLVGGWTLLSALLTYPDGER